MIRHIPVTACAVCPFRQFHYSQHECSRMNFQRLPKQDAANGTNPAPPEWCPLPPHPSFIREVSAADAGRAKTEGGE